MFTKKILVTSLSATLALSTFSALNVHAQKATSVSYKAALTDSAAFTYAMSKTPDAKSGSTVLTLANAQFPVAKNYYNTYYKAITKEAKLDFKHYTSVSNYAMAVIALTAIGKDATNVDGVNVIEKMLNFAAKQNEKASADASFQLLEMDYYWLLTALDTKKYTIPSAYTKEFSREAIVQFLVAHAYENGGFSWGAASEWVSGPDVDSTAMTIIALAPYQNQSNVATVITSGFKFIKSQMGKQAGFYSAWANGDSPESVSQLILAQIATGHNPKTNTQFILNNGAWTIANLLTSYDRTYHAFKSSSKGTINQISNQQAAQALTAYDKKVSYYNLATAKAPTAFDTTAPKVAIVKAVSNKTVIVKGTAERYATVTVKANGKLLSSKLVEGNGTYALQIKKQNAGTKLSITVIDTAGNRSKEKIIKVLDKVAPNKPIVNTVKAGQKIVSGKVEKHAKIIVKIGRKQYIAKANATGIFKVKIPAQKVNKKLVVTAKDTAGNVSKSTTIKVK